VDKTAETVVQTWVLLITDELKQEIKNIATSDSQVQRLVAEGAYFRSFTPTFWQGYKRITGTQGTIQELGPIGFMAIVTLDQGIHWYTISIDLAAHEVIDVNSAAFPWFYWINVIFTILILLLTVVGIIILVGMFRKLRATSSGYLSILLGIIPFCTVLMFNPRNWIMLSISVYLPPIVGLTLGIVGALKKPTWRGNILNIVGIILSSLAIALVTYAFVWNMGHDIGMDIPF